MTDTDKGYVLIPRTQQLLVPNNQTGIEQYVSAELHTGSLTATIKVLSDTHIGSGSHMSVNGNLVLGNLVAADGFPIIPASSIKGYLRNMVATIAGDSTKKPPVDAFTESIFGKMSKRSKVSIGETINISKQHTTFTTVPRRWSPQDFNYDERRFYPLRARVKISQTADGNIDMVPIAVIPLGTELSWGMTFQNLDSMQLGTILIALGYNKPDFAFNIGGAKAFGCGIVQVTDLKVLVRNRSFTTDPLSSSDLDTMTQLVINTPGVKSVLDELYNIFHWPII